MNIFKAELKLDEDFIEALSEGKYKITNMKIDHDVFATKYLTFFNGTKGVVELLFEDGTKVKMEISTNI